MELPGVRLAGDRLIASFRMGSRLPEYSLVFELVRVINEQMRSGKAASLDVLYGRFVSFFTQVPTVEKVLPIGAAAPQVASEPLVFEPGGAALLDALLPHFLEVRLFDAVVQAFCAENAARMVAMQNAKSNALEIADTFTLLYNKTRQERITSEILDLANKGKKK
jgi:F-type H+-transporting ATPase subunit gamma